MSIDITKGHNHDSELKRPLVDKKIDSFHEMNKISVLIQNVRIKQFESLIYYLFITNYKF